MALPDRHVQSAIANNRFGIGARDDDLKIATADPRGWLLAQLDGPPPGILVDAGLLQSSRDSLITYGRLSALRREMTENPAAAPEPAKGAQGVGQFTRAIYRTEIGARVRTAIVTDRPLAERMVWFWANHFTVSAGRPAVAPIAGAFEREVIRPHVFGRFETMLLAATRHPAMILYLDNQRSVGPASPRGRRIGRGLNENLAREILELHTICVDGGYGQTDVTVFAKALTGWTVGGGARSESAAGGFLFTPDIHEPGARTIMGRTYAQDGEAQAEAILRDLARHPATGRHLALKLARHVIADDPPPEAVDRLAGVFMETDGDLAALTRAVIGLDAAWHGEQRKLKTPHDFVVSSLRGLGMSGVEGRSAIGAMDTLGQRPFWAPSPAGWPDTADQWAGPDALYKRIEWAALTGERAGVLADRPAELMSSMLGAQATGRLLEGVSRAGSGAQAVTLLLSSPEFQRR